jgi:hypothetical protein
MKPPFFQKFADYPSRVYAEKVGAHDPRGAPRAFDPVGQPDEVQLAQLKAACRENFVPLAEIVRRQNLSHRVARIRYTPYVIQTAGVAGGQYQSGLLIPQNRQRFAWRIQAIAVRFDTTIFVSLGAPMNLNNPAGAPSVVYGFPLTGSLTNASFSAVSTNGTVATDDIYVTYNPVNGPFVIVGWEGVLALEPAADVRKRINWSFP